MLECANNIICQRNRIKIVVYACNENITVADIVGGVLAELDILTWEIE